MPMTKPGQHLRVTDEATVALVRRLAEHYDDRTIAAILAKQKRRTATGLPFTRARVAILRAGHDIPVYQPPHSPMSDPTATMSSWSPSPPPNSILGVARTTLYRWIRDGFVTAEQITPGAPWRIRIDQALRDRIRPEVPDGLARPRRGRHGTRRRPTNRVAQGPTRRTASRPRQPRTPQRAPYPGQTRPAWTVRHTLIEGERSVNQPRRTEDHGAVGGVEEPQTGQVGPQGPVVAHGPRTVPGAYRLAGKVQLCTGRQDVWLS